MAFHIILENAPGCELQRWTVENENDLHDQMIAAVDELGSINPGDTFRVTEDE